MSNPPINTATLAIISVIKCKYALFKFMLACESFFNNSTLKPLPKIAMIDNQITKPDSISCGFWKRSMASIINRTATIIKVEALMKAANISARL